MTDMLPQQKWFPVVLNLNEGCVIVIGGGDVALNKTRLLLDCGAYVHILAPSFSEALLSLKKNAQLRLVTLDELTYTSIEPYIKQARLIYIATDDALLNTQLHEKMLHQPIPVCCVDDPKYSNFITPAIVRRGSVQIAISTGGGSPVLARYIRYLIERVLPHGLPRLAHFMSVFRIKVTSITSNIGLRRHIWERFLASPGAEYAQQGDFGKAQEVLSATIKEDGNKKLGEIWLVGAGPGNPDLLTLAALRLLQQADSILYDNLVNPEILDYSRRDAQCIYVGKQKGHHVLSQEEIHYELIKRARRGERVLRLKGGDPFVFGRGGEEMSAIVKAGINVRIIPAITAANGCASYAGIPLTYRGCAQQCLFITGHARPGHDLDISWDAVALKNQTIVIYMGLTHIESLCRQLIAHGLPKDWPAAIVSNGTLASQRVVAGTLTNLPHFARIYNVTSPALVIIGEVIKHRLT